MYRFFAAALIAIAVAAPADATIVLTSASPVSAVLGDFVRTPSSTTFSTYTVASNQAGGTYGINLPLSGSVPALVGAATLASNGVPTPSFAMTVQNMTGSEIVGLTISGLVIQLKDNSSNVVETLVGTVSGLTGVATGALNFGAVSNDGNTSSNVNSPALTRAYNVSLSSISLANGASATFTWTDSNDSGTDAMFGLANVAFQGTLAAIPEPTAALFGGLVTAALGLTVARRPAQAA